MSTPLTDAINALTTYANSVTGESDTNLSDAVYSLAQGYGQGSGSNLTDAYVVTARDSEGYPTAVDYYNTDGEIPRHNFSNTRSSATSGQWCFGNLKTISLKGSPTFKVRGDAFNGHRGLVTIDWDKITEFPDSASSNVAAESSQFRDCKSLVTVNAPNLTGAIGVYAFFNCTALTTVYMPKISELCGYSNNRGCFGSCTALTTAEFGSIGYPVTAIHNYAFNGVTQSGLTITVYTTSAYADTALANLRNCAINAAIIIKAAEAMTYNGNSYSAGDTIITSTP